MPIPTAIRVSLSSVEEAYIRKTVIMLIPKLAIRNLLGAGLRTWLNVIVLSFAYVAIIFNQGFYYGLTNQVSHAKKEAELGGGQFWHHKYDPHDPFTLQDAYGDVPESMRDWIDQDKAVPILIIQGTFYPKGRIRTVIVKGIPPPQKILSIPTRFLQETEGPLQALIGTRMAKSTGLEIGDIITVKWQDANGTFDAQDVEIVQIMNTTVPTIDHGQIWVPLERFRQLLQIENEATMVVIDQNFKSIESVPGWIFRNLTYLLKDIHDVNKTRTVASWLLYGLLLMLAMLAIFDTQILSVFRRRKEIGTLISLGMTRSKVIQLFTFEGALHGVLAAFIGALYGIPLLDYFADKGFAVPETVDNTGYAIGEKLYPLYGTFLVAETTLLVLILTTIVSYLPTRKITKLKPTDALR